MAEYDDVHPTPATLRAACRKEVQNEFSTVIKSIDKKIQEEFTPLPNVASLSLKDAVYEGIQAVNGTLIEDLGVAEIVTGTVASAAFGAGLGAVIGATAAVITLPLNPYIANAVTLFVNTALNVVKSSVQSNCDGAGQDLSALVSVP